MIEFAINKSVHASTTHTLFYVIGLRHPRNSALKQSDAGLGGGTRLSKIRFVFCSSRIIAHADTFNADVDIVDIDSVDIISSEDAATTSDNDDDAAIFSIINAHASKEVDTLAEEDKNLLAVRTRRIERHNNELA